MLPADGVEKILKARGVTTTRDSIAVDLERDGHKYRLIDTAGLRRRGKVEEAIEKFSVVKTLQAIEHCQVAVIMLDAGEGVTDQDATVLGAVLDAGRALVVAINKWDGQSDYQRKQTDSLVTRKLGFVNWAESMHISALHGSGLGELFKAIHRAHRSATHKFSTAEVTKALEIAYDHARLLGPLGAIPDPGERRALLADLAGDILAAQDFRSGAGPAKHDVAHHRDQLVGHACIDRAWRDDRVRRQGRGCRLADADSGGAIEAGAPTESEDQLLHRQVTRVRCLAQHVALEIEDLAIEGGRLGVLTHAVIAITDAEHLRAGRRHAHDREPRHGPGRRGTQALRGSHRCLRSDHPP